MCDKKKNGGIQNMSVTASHKGIMFAGVRVRDVFHPPCFVFRKLFWVRGTPGLGVGLQAIGEVRRFC